MLTIAKLLCLVLFALGITSASGLLSESWSIVATIALVVAVAHLIEVVVMYKHVRRYKGPFATSILLTLLFGIAHWLPLAKQTSDEAH